MKRKRFPTVVEEATLKQSFTLEFVSHGPTERGWEGHYLKCPECKFLVQKGGGCHACPCGNIEVDSGMLRVFVHRGTESSVDTYRAIPK